MGSDTLGFVLCTGFCAENGDVGTMERQAQGQDCSEGGSQVGADCGGARGRQEGDPGEGARVHTQAVGAAGARQPSPTPKLPNHYHSHSQNNATARFSLRVFYVDSNTRTGPFEDNHYFVIHA